MNGHSPTERQWILIRTLVSRRYGATVKELAETLSVSLKTIRRDLELLQGLGFPIAPREGEHGRNHWVVTADGNLPALTFNISEVLALYLGKKLMEPFAGTILWDSHHSAFCKIRAQLSNSVIDYLNRLQNLIFRTSFRDSNYVEKSQIIDDLMIGIEERRITFLTYHSARSTEPLTYDIYPYGLVYHRGSLYLVAHSQQHDQIRTFKVNRIAAVSLETLKFQRPANFQLRDYLQHSLGVYHSEGELQQVVIRFASSVARYVTEHEWHSSQKLTRLKDGSVRAEFELTSLEEIKTWVLSFGANAIVEEPETLRNEIVSEIQRTLEHYSARRNA